MTYTGKLYERLGGAFIETGYHTSDVDELTAAVQRLEADNMRLREAVEIITEVERVSGSDCIYCDRDHGNEFDEHSETCRIGRFMKEAQHAS
jgi:hypothetical protein